jgi:hypothetical protein
MGIDVISSFQNTFSANTLFANTRDLHFNADCRGVNGSLIEWNTFNSSTGISLTYDAGARTGVQNHNSYNFWTPLNSGTVEVRHFSPAGSIPVILSRIRHPQTHPVGSLHFPAHTPITTPTQAGIFRAALNDDITPPDDGCLIPNNCNVMAAATSPNPELDYAAIVQDASSWIGLSAAEQAFQRQEIFGMLLDYPNWLNNGTLSTFKAAHQGSFVGQSESLRKAWMQLHNDIAAHQATLAPTYANMEAISNQLKQWFDAIAADPSLEAGLQSQINAALQQAEALQAQIQQAEDQFAPTVHSAISQLLAQNAALDESTTYSWGEKRFNQVMLNWMGGTEPGATAIADLRQIAQTCLSDGGRAVLWARGICATWLKEYYGEGNCYGQLQGGSGEREAKPTEQPTKAALRIVPNPADDMVRVSLGLPMGDGESLQVMFYNLSGKAVYTATLTSANMDMPIPVKAWPEGLYVAKVIAHGKTISKTFVVQHR